TRRRSARPFRRDRIVDRAPAQKDGSRIIPRLLAARLRIMAPLYFCCASAQLAARYVTKRAHLVRETHRHRLAHVARRELIYPGNAQERHVDGDLFLEQLE